MPAARLISGSHPQHFFLPIASRVAAETGMIEHGAQPVAEVRAPQFALDFAQQVLQ